MKNNYSYTGKTIFVGIDVHKKTYSVAIVYDGVLIKRDTMSAFPHKLIDYLLRYFPGAKIYSAYEAGFSGFGLHRYLLEKGVKNIVVNAASVEIGSRDRVKNDKRDAVKIAVQLSAGRLRGIFVPSPEVEDKRALTRHRSTLVKDRNRTAARLKHKANYYGLIGPEDCTKVSSLWIKKIREKEIKPGLKYVIEALVEEWESLNQKIKELDKLLAKQAIEDHEVEKVYTSVKGIGKTAARILANELGDMSQFSSEGGLFSYTGLTPSEYSSGEHTRRGHISRQGKPILRSILVQCSWVAIRYNPGLREIFERISKRAGAKRAIVAIARRLIGRIRACFRKGETYCEQFPVKETLQVA
jgi:transposase